MLEARAKNIHGHHCFYGGLRRWLGGTEVFDSGLSLSVVSRHVLALTRRAGLCVPPVRSFPIQRDWQAFKRYF